MSDYTSPRTSTDSTVYTIMQPLSLLSLLLTLPCVACGSMSVGVGGSVSSSVTDPLPWCTQPLSNYTLPSPLDSISGSADDQCQHFYISSGVSLAKLDVKDLTNIMLFVDNAVPPVLQNPGYSYISDFEYFSGRLYVPIYNPKSRNTALVTYSASTLQPMDNVNILYFPAGTGLVSTVMIDYTTSNHTLYCFFSYPDSSKGKIQLVSTVNDQLAYAGQLEMQGTVISGAISGSMFLQPGVAYLLVNLKQQGMSSSNDVFKYQFHTVDLRTGNVSLPFLQSTSNNRPTSLANIWSADAVPQVGLLHLTSDKELINYQLCQDAHHKFLTAPTINCPDHHSHKERQQIALQ